MRARPATPRKRSRPAASRSVPPSDAAEIDRLRLERLAVDSVTGLMLHPLWDLGNERVASLGILYFQLCRYAVTESFYGWELYDRVLRISVSSLKEDLEASKLRPVFLSMRFNGCDGFYLLFDLSARGSQRPEALLEAEAAHFRQGLTRRLRKSVGRGLAALMDVYSTSLLVADDPRVRPSRNLIRGFTEAVRNIDVHESGNRHGMVQEVKAVLSGRRLRAVYQPVIDIQTTGVLGYEALIRGPAGSVLEFPDALFPAAHQADLSLELESLCLETIFGDVSSVLRRGVLFVNASARLLTHSVFLDERNLAEIRRAHPSIVLEVSEKEIVLNYSTFREVLQRLRGAGFRIAIDDAGSGYSGLESVLQIRPEFIKVASSLVHNLHVDRIKREIILALASVGRQIGASLVAEGIEQEEDLRVLVELGIPYGQGFLLGRPSAKVPTPRRHAQTPRRAGPP